MKVLVCGGRDFNDAEYVFHILDGLHVAELITQVISGGARGADTLGERWAVTRHVELRRFPAEWDKYGGSAGPRRNQQMIDEGQPDMVVAFPGGKGTQDMVRRAHLHGIRVEVLV